ncbi:MAG: VTC domain-containing protein [Chloroflexi bacterium]|nr:VTC domain-containing protein [Chloroflexota bacterium]
MTSEPTPVGGQFRQRFERKFYIIPQRIDLAYALLRQFCRPDREYPHGRINSLYFDTPDLDQHERSAAGEYNKDKVRIRWYGEKENLSETVPVFLELKSRRGFASSKKREKFQVASEALQQNRVGEGIIDRKVLVDTVAGFGHFTELPLRPIITVSYSRYRFTEIFSGIRVSLDYDIRSTFVARGFGNGERELQLRGAVIEVKGPTMDLPTTLRRMKLLDTDWSRFSKYSHCIDSHLEDPGAMARLWPSGRVGDV